VTCDGYAALIDALRDIDHVPAHARGWEALIARAREADLLGTIEHRLRERGSLERVPDAPRAHFTATRILANAQEAAVRREIDEIVAALRGVHAPIVLLKGAAYLLAGLPAAHGRFFSDVDILVPKHALPGVESALMLGGFATTHLHPHDQRYYRRWMHELPPMQHMKRLTVVDVHHALVPETGRVHPDAAALFRAAVPIPRRDDVMVLAPADMVLHSATHLFHNEEVTHGLRDLVDIDRLLRHFAASDPRFFDQLLLRAAEMDLARPLYYAMRFAARLLGTPIADAALANIDRYAPPAPARILMYALLAHALSPTAERPATRWARRALDVRGHWLKMPVPLLAWHLTVKSFRRKEQAA
jgi:putative nucleotidyltransferase-like protein